MLAVCATGADSMTKATSRRLEEWANPRTVIAFSLLFVIALWSAVTFWVVSARSERIAATSEALQRMNHAVEDQMRRQFRLVSVFLAACANWLEDNRDRDPRHDPGFRRLIEGFRSRTAEAIDIRLLASDGSAFDVLADAPAAALPNVADRDYFLRAPTDGSLYIGDPKRHPSDDRPRLPVALRLAGPQDFPIVVAEIDLSKLSMVLERQRRKPGGVITLLRSDGTLLAMAPDDPSLLGRPIATPSPPTTASAEPAPQSPRVVLSEGSGGQRRLSSLSPVTDFPLLVIVSADYDETLAAWLKQTLWIVILALGVTVPLAVVALRSLRLLQALASRDAELLHLATTDQLTGVSSRQHFVALVEEQLRRARQQQEPLSLLLFDIDFFKRINDGYGHGIGDQALIAFARAASKCLRDRDAIGRLGGGKFAMLLLGTASSESVAVAERIRHAVATISIPSENGVVQFTVSVGASQAGATDDSFDDLLRRATAALHAARSGGPDHLLVV